MKAKILIFTCAALLAGCSPQKPSENPFLVGQMVYHKTDTNRVGVVIWSGYDQCKVRFRLKAPMGDWLHGYFSYTTDEFDFRELLPAK